MIESGTFVISAWHHVVDFVIEPFPPADPIAALQAAMRGEMRESALIVPLVSTGVYSGPIDLTVEVLDARPEATAPEWEDIHELSLMLPEGRAYFNRSASFERKDVGSIMGDEQGSHRARLHASGRDAAYDEVVDSPVERHLVQFWKEPPSPVSVLSSNSQRGKSLPRFIEMWQGPPTAASPAEPRPVTREPRAVRMHGAVIE
ncbi:hypothetical protein [Salinibacterium sp. ZJ450]|uniref:hypothetical protein n=1 Tax=Salinibacterium sp. ZJ450 TaxID=2708338 RepID=UPI00142360A2|nr:hypothetical protein [Salinibacterium sp. ZJ450]